VHLRIALKVDNRLVLRNLNPHTSGPLCRLAHVGIIAHELAPPCAGVRRERHPVVGVWARVASACASLCSMPPGTRTRGKRAAVEEHGAPRRRERGPFRRITQKGNAHGAALGVR
jgi:hypothetical protein